MKSRTYFILIYLCLLGGLVANNRDIYDNKDSIAALELCLAEYGISAVNNTKRTLQIVNGTCEAWKCHATEGR